MARLLFDRRARLVCAGLWAIAWLGVAALLLLPLGVSTPGGSDLFGHFLLFATMAFAAVGFSRRPGQLACLTLVTIALGAALEYAQGFLSYRTSEIADAAANALGGLAGYGAALLVLYLVIRPVEPRLRAAP
ncbi:MAG: VanZ family protein [Geminicoccaceae bacterium]